MSREIEIERTYLVRFLPPGLEKCQSKEMIDIYLPKGVLHPKLRIRKSGDKCTITKKGVINKRTASVQSEDSINITIDEWHSLANVSGNIIKKTRYYYPYKNLISEIDVFHGRLCGLVLADFEFKSRSEANKFKKPDFCLADVTEEEAIAGGILSRHSFSSLKNVLDRFGFKRITL